MPSYKVHYFDARGRAEILRLMFKFAGKEFEDVRVSGDDWAKKKSEMPQGQLPVLEVDGTLIPQSGAIIRFVAEELGLFGQTKMERCQCDVILETINDALKLFRPIKMEANETKKEELKTTFQEQFPKFLTIFNKQLDGKTCLVGNKISVADIGFFDCIYEIRLVFGDVLNDQPQLAQVYAKVETKLSDYLKNRPVTKF